MPRPHRLGILLLLACAAILFVIAIPSLRSRANNAQAKPQAAPKSQTKSDEGEAFRNNTLGVAYMNQQKFAEAQKYFEKALACCRKIPTLGTTSVSYIKTPANPKRASRPFNTSRSFRLKPTRTIFSVISIRSFSDTKKGLLNFRRRSLRFRITPLRNSA